MAVITIDKVILIVVVTAIIIILAYVFRFGALFKRNKAPTDSTTSQQSPSGPK